MSDTRPAASQARAAVRASSRPLAIDYSATYKTRPLEYRAWSGMRTRVRNPKFKDWHRYGGRGIRVCERWNDFANFFADMGPKPTPRHTLDRIDSDGHYEPDNCRWATPKEQARNWASRNRRLTLGAETLPLSAWAERLGWRREVIRDRLNSGWSVERALTVPPIKIRKRRGDGTFAPVSH